MLRQLAVSSAVDAVRVHAAADGGLRCGSMHSHSARLE